MLGSGPEAWLQLPSCRQDSPTTWGPTSTPGKAPSPSGPLPRPPAGDNPRPGAVLFCTFCNSFPPLMGLLMGCWPCTCPGVEPACWVGPGEASNGADGSGRSSMVKC